MRQLYGLDAASDTYFKETVDNIVSCYNSRYIYTSISVICNLTPKCTYFTLHNVKVWRQNVCDK